MSVKDVGKMWHAIWGRKSHGKHKDKHKDKNKHKHKHKVFSASIRTNVWARFRSTRSVLQPDYSFLAG